MAGHSKWANIKFRKGAQDARRGKIFTKLIREITMAARLGAPDPAFNPRLRSALLAARAENMPKDTMEKAVKRGTGELDGTMYEEVRYEGYGPGGVAVIVETLTDNRNRTVGEVRHAFSRLGGNLGTAGSVAFLFDRKGRLFFRGVGEETLMEAAIEVGALDVEADEEGFAVYTDPEELHAVREAIEARGVGEPVEAGIVMIPQTLTPLTEEQAATMLKLLDILEDNDDVQKVYANFDIADDIMARLMGG